MAVAGFADVSPKLTDLTALSELTMNNRTERMLTLMPSVVLTLVVLFCWSLVGAFFTEFSQDTTNWNGGLVGFSASYRFSVCWLFPLLCGGGVLGSILRGSYLALIFTIVFLGEWLYFAFCFPDGVAARLSGLSMPVKYVVSFSDVVPVVAVTSVAMLAVAVVEGRVRRGRVAG